MRVYATISIGVLLAGALGIAHAVPLSSGAAGLKADAAGTSRFIEQVHGCNRTCQRGPVPEWAGVIRWHRHVGDFCRPIACTP